MMINTFLTNNGTKSINSIKGVEVVRIFESVTTDSMTIITELSVT